MVQMKIYMLLHLAKYNTPNTETWLRAALFILLYLFFYQNVTEAGLVALKWMYSVARHIEAGPSCPQILELHTYIDRVGIYIAKAQVTVYLKVLHIYTSINEPSLTSHSQILPAA